MDQDEIIELGVFAEVVLGDTRFHRLCDHFNTQVIASMLSTKPSQLDERERLYNRYTGYTEFLAFLKQTHDESTRLQAPPEPIDQVDDPSVHDIYRDED